MLSKRAKGYDPSQLPPSKRFRKNLADCFLSNEITGARAQELFNDAQAAGTADVKDLAGGTSKSNAARNLKKKLVRYSKWPKPYIAEVRMKDPKTEEVRALSKNMITLNRGYCFRFQGTGLLHRSR